MVQRASAPARHKRTHDREAAQLFAQKRRIRENRIRASKPNQKRITGNVQLPLIPFLSPFLT